MSMKRSTAEVNVHYKNSRRRRARSRMTQRWASSHKSQGQQWKKKSLFLCLAKKVISIHCSRLTRMVVEVLCMSGWQSTLSAVTISSSVAPQGTGPVPLPFPSVALWLHLLSHTELTRQTRIRAQGTCGWTTLWTGRAGISFF